MAGDAERFLHTARFYTGAGNRSQFPADEGTEVAFAGRSNVGKSSAINVLVSQRALARVSKQPGRTQQINFFQTADGCRLVDLPGYGYARVARQVRQQWQGLMSEYFENRCSLRGVVVLMDSRHPLTVMDRQMLNWCGYLELPVLLLLTKADKLNRSQRHNVLQQVRSGCRDVLGEGRIPVNTVLFSALKRTGVSQARDIIYQWLTGAADGLAHCDERFSPEL